MRESVVNMLRDVVQDLADTTATLSDLHLRIVRKKDNEAVRCDAEITETLSRAALTLAQTEAFLDSQEDEESGIA